MSADESSTSFELARFEWVDPTRLEVEGTWNGVSRLRARATLVIEVDGRRRRLRALPGDAGTPEKWSAAFGWDGDDMPAAAGRRARGRPRHRRRPPAPAQLQGPRPAPEGADPRHHPRRQGRRPPAPAARRRSGSSPRSTPPARRRRRRARAADAECRAERDELPGRQRRPRRPPGARGGGRSAAGAGEVADGLRAEVEALRARAGDADGLRAEVEELRARAAEADELRPPAPRRPALKAERERLLRRRGAMRSGLRSEQRGSDRAQASRTSGARCARRPSPARARPPRRRVAPDVARLRAELEYVERERTELRARAGLDLAAARGEHAGDVAPADRALDRRRARPRQAPLRPRRAAARPSGPQARRPSPSRPRASPTGLRLGRLDHRARARTRRSKNGERHAATPTAVAPRTAAARRTALRTAPRRSRESPSWLLRVAALLLLAFLLVTLVLIVSSLL